MFVAVNPPTRLCRGSEANRRTGSLFPFHQKEDGFTANEKRPMRIRPAKIVRAFSLVEVTLSLGIVAFVMVSVLGLMSIGIKANKESAEDIAVGFITQYIASTLHLEGFTEVSANGNYADADPDFYFDWNGVLSDQNSQDSLYVCTVTRSTPASAPADGTLFLKVEIAWPLQAPVANRTKQIIQISLANRE